MDRLPNRLFLAIIHMFGIDWDDFPAEEDKYD